jgi:hypothetical protein
VAEQYPTVEVAFSPTYGMPHFIASARAEDGDYLYELGDEGWRLTMLPDFRMGSSPVHPDLEDAFWRGAACLTGTPDLEAVEVPIVPGGVLGGAEGKGAK